MRFHLYIFFTMFCVHSFSFVFVFLCIMLFWCPTVVSQHLSRNDKRGWLTRWPPRSFANPIWLSAPLCLHWSTIVPLFPLTLMFANGWFTACDGFMMLLLVGWVIWNNKPLPLPLHNVWLSKPFGLDIAVLDDLFQMVACFYTTKQCSAINNLTIASTLQFFKSGLCNLKLCVTLGDM